MAKKVPAPQPEPSKVDVFRDMENTVAKTAGALGDLNAVIGGVNIKQLLLEKRVKELEYDVRQMVEMLGHYVGEPFLSRLKELVTKHQTY